MQIQASALTPVKAHHWQKTSPLAPRPAPQPDLETVQLSSRADSMEKAEVRRPPTQSGEVGRRLLAGLGLGLVALSLAGCNFGGGEPTPPVNQQQEQAVTAENLVQRLEQLRSQSDKTSYHQLAEAGYHRLTLERFSQAQGDATVPVREIAQVGLEAFDFKGDPATQQQAMREAMSAIAQLESEAPEVVRYSQAAQAALQVGQGFANQASKAPGGLVATLKSRGYEEGLKAALQRLQQAPDLLKEQSGYDPALIRNYVESLSSGTEIALEYASELGDPGLASVLYEQTGDVLYQRVKGDGQILGAQVTQALELIQSLRQQFGF